MRTVPVAWRTLRAHPGRFLGAASAVAVAITLIALLTGLWSGLLTQVTRYEDATGGQLFAVAAGTRTLVSDTSVPSTAVDQVRSTPGVAWAWPVRAMFSILELHDRKVAAVVIGYEPGGRGGPARLAQGRTAQDDELVVDETLAAQHGLKPGDTVTVLGRDLRIAGLSADTSGFMVGFVFTTRATADRLLEAPDTATFVLIGTGAPAPTAQALRAQGLTVIDRDQARDSQLQLATRVYGQPLKLMVGVAFAAGVLVIALTTYGAISEQWRLLGLLAALGGRRARLYRFAAIYVAATTFAGLLLSGLFFVIGRLLIGWWRPQFPIVLTPRDIATTIAAGLVMAALAGIWPARGVARTDPADAFRSTT